MADRKPMGCILLFVVIVAALLFVFVALPVSCTTAPYVAAFLLRKHADRQTQTGPQYSTNAPTPVTAPSVQESELIVALRERARWPVEVKVTRVSTAKLKTGEVALEVGRRLTVTAMNPDGFLKFSLSGIEAEVPFSDTDFVQTLSP